MVNGEFYKEMLNHLHDGVYFVDKERRITFWNKGAERITGYAAEEVQGSFCYNNILNHVDKEGKRLCLEGCPLHKTILDGFERTTDVFLSHKEGHRVPVFVRTIPIKEDGQIVGSVEIFQDDSERLEILSNMSKLKELAITDELSGISNRRYIKEYLHSKLLELESLGIDFGIAFMDIDDFKAVNDTYGHDVGDAVIKMVSQTCMSALRKTDLVGRWGGEEFIAIFIGVDEQALTKVSEKLRFLVEHGGFTTDKGDAINVTVSIGATMALHGDSVTSLVDRGDGLMYISKINGKNRVSV